MDYLFSTASGLTILRQMRNIFSPTAHSIIQNEEERTDIPVLIGNINSDGGAEQLYGGEPCAVRQNLPKEPALLARNSY